MVTHQTASLITANACVRTQPLARNSRSIVSRMAVIVQPSVPPLGRGIAGVQPVPRDPAAGGAEARVFTARGNFGTPHCSQFLLSVTIPMLRVTWSLTCVSTPITWMNT